MAVSDNISSINVTMPTTYRDLPIAFNVHPGTKDIKPISDIQAVKQAVKNLILTNIGERPFNPKIGSNVSKQLFEPAGPFTAQSIKMEILECLKRNEPRINGVGVRVFDNSDRNAYDVLLTYNIVSLRTQVETQFFLQRLR